jgi:hypothetical protein
LPAPPRAPGSPPAGCGVCRPPEGWPPRWDRPAPPGRRDRARGTRSSRTRHRRRAGTGSSRRRGGGGGLLARWRRGCGGGWLRAGAGLRPRSGSRSGSRSGMLRSGRPSATATAAASPATAAGPASRGGDRARTSRTCSVVARGRTCESPSRALATLSTSRFGTVRWKRRRSASSGSMVEGGGRTPGRVRTSASDARTGKEDIVGVPPSHPTPTPTVPPAPTQAPPSTSALAPTPVLATSGAAEAAPSWVTTSRRGGSTRGTSAPATSRASRKEQPRKRGKTSARLPAVMTLASSPTADKQSPPSRRAVSTSGNWGRSRAADKRR